MLALLLMTLQAQPVHVILSRPSGGPAQPSERVIRTKADWEDAWKTLPHRPEDRLPDVDFAVDCVVLVAWGTKPTGGYSISVESVEVKNGEAVVQVRRRKPTGIVTQALTAPCVVVRTARLPDRVRFVDVL
jgi:hypothetical protein